MAHFLKKRKVSDLVIKKQWSKFIFQYGVWGEDASSGLCRLKSDISQNEYLKAVKDNEYVKAIPQVKQQ